MFAYTKLMQAMAAAGVVSATDPYFNLTTLLLNTSSTNGAQNNTFLDSSTNNFTITRNGNTTQGTFTPFSQTGWSNNFNGSADYLSVADNAAWYFTGDFTVEAWVYLTAYPSVAATILAQWVDGGGTDRNFSLIVNSTGMPDFAINRSATSYSVTGATAIPLNTWTHVAGVLNGTSLKLYVNGTSVGTPATVAGSANNSTAPLGIGAYGNGSFKTSGYISNARVVSGSAVYTANFTPSTTPLTAITNTSLLTCQSNRFLDNSTNAFAITVNGTPSVQAFSPFAPTAAYDTAVVGGSGYFDAGSDYLTAPSTSGQFGASDFTLEAWIYPIARTNTQPCIYSNYSSYAAGSLALFAGHSAATTTKYQVAINGATFPVIESTSTIVYNQWIHLAVVRSSGVITLYINGVANGTYSTAATLNGTSGTSWIGVSGDNLVNAAFNGYISGLRSVVGTAVYTAAFTPPTAPLTAITNTKLLLSATNSGIFDSTAKNVLETVGNAQVSTTVAKWGTTSMYFDGTGDCLVIPNTPLLQMGSSDFTMEAWIYPTATTNQTIFAHEASGVLGFQFALSATTLKLEIALSSNGTSYGTVVTSTSAVTVNQWSHVAVVRSGSGSGNITLYINGVKDATTGTFAGTMNAPATTFQVGCRYASGVTQPFNGYIDDARITKYARYSANFTAPTAAFALQ
jgi:hypothetical protein